MHVAARGTCRCARARVRTFWFCCGARERGQDRQVASHRPPRAIGFGGRPRREHGQLRAMTRRAAATDSPSGRAPAGHMAAGPRLLVPTAAVPVRARCVPLPCREYRRAKRNRADPAV